jgi:hypothetical protein
VLQANERYAFWHEKAAEPSLDALWSDEFASAYGKIPRLARLVDGGAWRERIRELKATGQTPDLV